MRTNGLLSRIFAIDGTMGLCHGDAPVVEVSHVCGSDLGGWLAMAMGVPGACDVFTTGMTVRYGDGSVRW
jgi:hypothetical protein